MKHYLDKNVYEATQERLKFIFENFDNVYVSFPAEKTADCCLIWFWTISGSIISEKKSAFFIRILRRNTR